MKLTILRNDEQRKEAMRAIVTAQHEIDSDGVSQVAGPLFRRAAACEWLSLIPD